MTNERLETLEERIDAKFDSFEHWMEACFARAEAEAERRANRHTAIFIGALAVAVGVIAILIGVL